MEEAELGAPMESALLVLYWRSFWLNTYVPTMRLPSRTYSCGGQPSLSSSHSQARESHQLLRCTQTTTHVQPETRLQRVPRTMLLAAAAGTSVTRPAALRRLM